MLPLRSVSGGRGGSPPSDGVDALCGPHPLANRKAEADRGDVRGRPPSEFESRPCGFLSHFQRIHASPTNHRRVYYTNTKLAQGATMTRGDFNDAACADLSKVRSLIPRTRRSIATAFSAPRGTTTSAWRFVGRTNSSKAGLTNCS